jgi:diacylglycerol O-acyltransferase / wax synthase
VDQTTTGARLSAADSLLWRIECDPVLRTPVVVVGLLDRSPTPEGVEATIERAAGLLPRLAQRLDPPPLDMGRPRWRPSGEPSLAAHIRRVAAPGGGLEAALAVAEPDAAAAFDPVRSPWTMTVVDGLDRGRSAVILRFHHTLTDGVGGIEIAEQLFDRTRRPRAGDTPEAPPPAPTANGASPAPWPAALVDGARSALGALRRPWQAMGVATRMASSTVRTLAPAPRNGSPVLTGRSLDRRLAVLERPLGELQAAARATGGTVNDVLLAAVGGALAEYHWAQGGPVPAVRVLMPISIRRPGDPIGGNRFVPARFTLPIDDPDPVARVRIAGALVRSWRREPALGATDLLAAGIDFLPRALAARLFGGMLRSVDVDVVDVPGLRRRAYLGGARLDRLWAFAPPTGAALSVTLVSHDGKACIGLACDQLAVTDPEGLEKCLDAALDELAALGKGGPA